MEITDRLEGVKNRGGTGKKTQMCKVFESYKVQLKFQTLPNAQGFEFLKFSFKFII